MEPLTIAHRLDTRRSSSQSLTMASGERPRSATPSKTMGTPAHLLQWTFLFRYLSGKTSSMKRRTVLGSVGSVALAGLAGCTESKSEAPPAGSLRFVNESSTPRIIRMHVTDVGSESGTGPGTVSGNPNVRPAQRNLTAATTIEPGETQTYESVFTTPNWYAIRFTVSGQKLDDAQALTSFHPAPNNGEKGTFLSGRISNSGEFAWTVTATGDSGPFKS